MKNEQDADADKDQPTHYMRLPWPLVGAGLIALLAVVFGIGLYANRNLRPQVGLVPTTEPTAVAAPPAATATPQVATAIPAAAPTLVVQVIATATPPQPTAAPTSAPLVVASPTPPALPTVEPALADEVGRAYVMFWRVRSQALLELDSSRLAATMDGDYLTNTENLVDELRAENRAIKTQVVLNYTVFQATSESAIVVDYFEDNSVYVKIGTEEPLSEPTADQLRVMYRFMKFPDGWKVVDSVRSE